MSQAWRKRGIKVCYFILSRFPFVNALTLLMLLGERAIGESYPPINPKIIYIHLGLFIVCGALMSALWGGKSVPLVYAGQLLYFAYNAYSNNTMGYNWLRTLISARHLGCSGVYIGLAYLSDQASGKQLQQVSYSILGIYCMCIIVALNDNNEAYLAFIRYFPLADITHFIVSIILGCCAVSLFSSVRRFLCKTFFTLAMLLTLMSLFIDSQLSYWTDYKKVHFWNQIRLIADQVCIITGLVLFGFHHY